MAFYRRVLGIAVLGSVSLLSGCGNFFSCEGKASCPTGGGGGGGTTNSGDLVYVSNSAGGTTNISGYTLASGTLTAISGGSLNVGYTPIAMVVSPNNGFLYVATNGGATNAGVYVYSISSTGALTEINNNGPIASDDGIASMDISPDGNYLYTLSSSGIAAVILNQYQMNTSTGLPTVSNPTTFQTVGTSCLISGIPLSQQCTVKVSPNDDYVAVALAGYGFEVFPDTSTSPGGITSAAGQLSPSPSTLSGDFSLAFDENLNLYVASTTALTPFSGLNGTPVAGTAITYAGGVTPRSVTVATNSGAVYTANEGNGTISGFSFSTTGVLTAIAGTPIAGPANVSALGVDSTGDYLVAAGYGTTNGLQVFTISSTGALSPVGTPIGTQGADDTSVPIVMALSH